MLACLVRNPMRCALTCCLLPLFFGCASTDNGAPPPTSLQAIASRDAQSSTFVKLLQQTGLDDLLTGSTSVTLFIPSDEAFLALPVSTLDRLAKNPQALRALLKHHAVAGTPTLAPFGSNGIALTTLAGGKLVVSKAGDFITVEDAMVTQTDLSARNGTLHRIDRVLAPPPK